MFKSLTTTREYDYIIKLIFLGDEGVGKTTLLVNFAEGAEEHSKHVEEDNRISLSEESKSTQGKAVDLSRETAQFGN